MTEQRPNPDTLLARVQAEEARQQRGQLKIFFGATAGVGKTYAMLEAAHERKRDGVDVLVGWVDTHGRKETEALLAGLEILPRRPIEYRGAAIGEFDLDTVLVRHPELVLVDELAHSNVPGSRHAKRWQDIEELLNAGINVYTTVNVQHIESLNDVVAQITGVIIRETVPDFILEQADEVELIDLTPDELLERLRDGKVYLPHQAERAIRSFFRKGNLIALRELALRRTADRVDAQMQAYRRDHAIASPWPTAERILVCIGPNPLAARLVRAARRMAAGLHAEWIVVYVETSTHLRMPEVERDRVVETLRLAEQLGAETVTLSGQNVSEEILTYAHQRNVTKLVVGKPTHSRWRDFVFGSVLDDLVRQSGEIDVHVISGDEEVRSSLPRRVFERTSNWSEYVKAFVVVIACSFLAWLMFGRFGEANLVMVYLLGVVIAAARLGRGPSIFASILSVAAFDFFFVEPNLTFAVSDADYLVTFAVMLVVALVISTLTYRLRLQAGAARSRERRAAALYSMSRDLASTRGIENLLPIATRHISETFDSRVALFLPNTDRGLEIQAEGPTSFDADTKERGVAQWVYEHGQRAGLGMDTLPGAAAVYMPLAASRGTVGVLGIRPTHPRTLLAPEQLHLLETFAAQTALAVERARLGEETEQTRIQMETEQLRSSLLSSVSHDLRTPLASITGAASTLLDNQAPIDAATRQELTQTVYDEAHRLNRLVSNLLEMTRLESGGVQVRKEWYPLEEVVGAALARLDAQLHNHLVTTDLDPDLPLIPLDDVLIEQVLINILENAVKYTPPRSPIEISAREEAGSVLVEIADKGPGLPPGDEQRIFDKFYRGERADGRQGAGLGLAIAQAIVEAHGGRIWAENLPTGGAAFRWTLPMGERPPQVAAEPTDALMVP